MLTPTLASETIVSFPDTQLGAHLSRNETSETTNHIKNRGLEKWHFFVPTAQTDRQTDRQTTMKVTDRHDRSLYPLSMQDNEMAIIGAEDNINYSFVYDQIWECHCAHDHNLV